jgi:hypothetical protein
MTKRAGQLQRTLAFKLAGTRSTRTPFFRLSLRRGWNASLPFGIARLAIVLTFVLLSGCGTYRRVSLNPQLAKQIEIKHVQLHYNLTPQQEEKILALDPQHVTAVDITNALAGTPAPRMILIHGGLDSVIARMVSFGDFLIGMGYPAQSITNPGDGTYTFSCLESARMLTGICAWYYEKEGLRPMLIGHSQGGFQVVKILNFLAGERGRNISVWSPLTWKSEKRIEFTDPLTGEQRTVVGLTLPYGSSLGAGGMTRILPNQWDMMLNLRAIPDSVEEFTGFYNGPDWKGGDFWGYGPANHSYARGTAKVRTVNLPSDYAHGQIPDTRHLLKSEAMKTWINNYRPSPESYSEPKLDVTFESDSRHILWAADVWFSIKKHWVIELQNLIRARRAARHAH